MDIIIFSHESDYTITNKTLLDSDEVHKKNQFCKRLPDVIVLGVKKCGTITLGKQNKIELNEQSTRLLFESTVIE